MIWTYLVCLGCALTIERPGEKLAEESCAAAGGDNASLVEQNAPEQAAARCCCPTQSSSSPRNSRHLDRVEGGVVFESLRVPGAKDTASLRFLPARNRNTEKGNFKLRIVRIR